MINPPLEFAVTVLPSMTTTCGVPVGLAALIYTAPSGLTEIRCPLTVISPPGVSVCEPIMRLELLSARIVWAPRRIGAGGSVVVGPVVGEGLELPGVSDGPLSFPDDGTEAVGLVAVGPGADPDFDGCFLGSVAVGSDEWVGGPTADGEE